MALPSMVESNWKSIAHTTFGASASTGGMEDTPARLRGRMDLHLQPFLAPQPVNLLLVDLTALVVAQRRPGPPEPMARVLGGIRAQPGPRLGIRISPGLPDRQGSVGGTASPTALHANRSDSAQFLLEHVHGATLGSRAQNFPLATSRSASFSNSASASRRFNLEFCSRASASTHDVYGLAALHLPGPVGPVQPAHDTRAAAWWYRGLTPNGSSPRSATPRWLTSTPITTPS